ncbi:FtsH protease activity modulator HflK [Rhizobium sp. TRM96647]|uniref:FtsH protease activity modulator HflK n=1 Tax=unclassified Rhizobium TaxID=2613769 RepID=UPI0021E96C8B|nr:MULTISPECIES: FtsH protease activity modulator HflK [unclassified Rhizobium]MCV3736878.1 FtsH protease activity modulator HflK [Rhizobium sp. TRM96647]MCV3756722.1 FtsH protease activity modulator HflK [Rhizobium sp. TRM96650]
MPWSNQNGGGGPWGGGGGNNQGPWGQGPNRPRGNGSGGPPDLEEIIRRGQDQLKNVVPGGFNGGIFVIAALLIGVFWLMNSIYTVQPDERGVELRFGKPKDEVSMPGLHFHFWPFETVEMVTITEQQQNIGRKGASVNAEDSGLMLSGDQNIVNVQFSVLYSVTDPRAYLFNLENPSSTLQQVSESAMREVVGRRPAQDIFRDNRQAIAEAVKATIQATMDGYGAGISVNTVAIEDAAPPREVADAFDEVQRAEQDEDRFVEEANQYSNQKLGLARGQAAQIREEAAAYKNRVVNEAEGEAQRFISIYDQYRLAPDVTRQRMFLETMEGVLKGSKTVVIDEKQGGQGVVPFLPLNELSRTPPGQAQGQIQGQGGTQ